MPDLHTPLIPNGAEPSMNFDAAAAGILAQTGGVLPMDSSAQPHPELTAWISPQMKQRMRSAAMPPRRDLVVKAEAELASITPELGQPAKLSKAVSDARKLCTAAHEACTAAINPETGAISQELKAKATKAIEAAEASTTKATGLAASPEIVEEWLAAIVSRLDSTREAAKASTEQAARDWAAWREVIGAAETLGERAHVFTLDYYRGKDWRSQNPTGLSGELRRARDIAANGDSFVTGEYLKTLDSCEVPAQTLERLENSPAAFEREAGLRLRAMAPEDTKAREAARTHDLRPLWGS